MQYWWQLKYVRRRREIVGAFARHGMDFVFSKFGLGKPSGIGSVRTQIHGKESNDYIMARNLREAFMELGPTFVKFGQVLSTRVDILPRVYIKELEQLQDKVNPMSHEDLKVVVKEELGCLEDIFSDFDWNPLAAASIGQVHRARLHTGEEVIVKIQRPGIESMVRKDLEILKGLARRAERRSPEASQIGVVAIIEDFAKTLLRELDYEREARNTEKVYQNFLDDKRVVIPRVYGQYSTPRVLIEDYIAGYKLSDIESIDKAGWDRRNISRLGTEAFLSQILLHGFFQADPHPGNILAVDENTISFIDFGQMGYLGERRLVYIGELLISISKKDPYRATSVLRDMGVLNDIDVEEGFSEDLGELIGGVMSGNIGDIDMKRLRVDIMDLAFRYNLRMPSYLTSLMKALITVEGLGNKLDPSFEFTEVAGPLASRVYRERLKPENVSKYLRSRFYQDIKPLGEMPTNLNRVLKNAGAGRLQLNFQMDLSPRMNRKITQLVSRLGLSMMATGALIGSALILQANHSTEIAQYAYLGVVGFGLAIAVMLAFFFGSLRG